MTNSEKEKENLELKAKIMELNEIGQKSKDYMLQSDRPILYFDEIKLSKKNRKVEGFFAPELTFRIMNIGNRPASPIEVRPQIVSFRFGYSKVSGGELSEKFNFPVLEQKTIKPFIWEPKFTVDITDDFFFLLQILYFDEFTGDRYVDHWYFHYFKKNNEFEFNECNIKEAKIVFDSINKYLEYNNYLPLLTDSSLYKN